MHVIVDAYKLTGEERYWKMIVAYAQYLVRNLNSPYGIFCLKPFMSSFIVSSAIDIYFLLPENTPVERTLKEQLLLVIQSATNGSVYWGGNSITGNSRAWGEAYSYRADSVYARPSPSDISGAFYYVSYCANGLGLMHFLMGDSVYRNVIGRSNPNGSALNPPQNFMSSAVGSAPVCYYRLSSAAWYCPDQKKSARPGGITNLSAAPVNGRRAALQWTSVGGSAYRIYWSDKPIVEKLGRIAPLDSGDIYFPYPDTVKALTNIFRAVPIDAPVIPKSAGGAESFTTCALPDSLGGRKVYFAVRAVNIVSEVDQSRGPLSNLDSVTLDTTGLSACASSAAANIIREVHTTNAGELFVTLGAPLSPIPAVIGIALSDAVTRAPLLITSVEIDTSCGSLLRVRTSGLVEGEQYRLQLDSTQNAFYFLADFSPSVFSQRKIHFGNSYHGNGYQVGHRWDGDYGFNTFTWNAVAWYDWDPASITDSSVRGCIGLNYVPYGSEWFKITVSREIQDYLFSAYVNADSPRRLQAEDTLVWNSKAPTSNIIRTDTIPLKIKDGCLDLTWEHLTYVQLKPVFKYMQSVVFADVSTENRDLARGRGAFLYNYPNPFNPATRISFSAGRADARSVRLLVYDTRGRLVRDLTPVGIGQGEVCTVEWDGFERSGKKAASGVYCAKLTMGNKNLLRKMILIK
jgi:hypothetical protein